MTQLGLALIAATAAEAVIAIVFAALIWRFYQSFARGYLEEWSRSWFAAALHYTALVAFVYLVVARELPPGHPIVALAAIVFVVAGVLQILWLALGVHELAFLRPVKLRHARYLRVGVASFSFVAAVAVLLATNRAETAYALLAGGRALFAVVVLTASGFLIWRLRGGRDALGLMLFSVGLFVFAAVQIAQATLGRSWATVGDVTTPFIVVAVIDCFAVLGLGLGMIIAVLEDEREGAVMAASQIEHLAYHDALTGLPNRALFFDRLIIGLAQADRYEFKTALFFIDLDRFKDINDSLGHSVGDALLKTAAKRIRDCVRQGDTVARFGGDEFTVLVPQIERVEDAAKIAHKIIESMKAPFIAGDREIVLTSSIGISVYPEDGTDAETLVKNADIAMYRAKEQGRDNYQLYTASMNSKAIERLELENRLRKALNRGELDVHYQPLVHLANNTIFGFEALLRWDHPELGVLTPEQFISSAEVSGVITPIGEWALQKACRQAKEWQDQGMPDISVSVNLSSRQIQQADLAERVRSALELTGLSPASLELEITENHAMQNAEQSIRIMRELKNLGVRLSMDDFGTGYSSLSYLKRFPIDTLKLDRSFVRDIAAPGTGAIITAVISMAHTLGLKVIAEGVETEAQLGFLRKHLCDAIQGYLFSAPLSAVQCDRFLADNRRVVAAG